MALWQQVKAECDTCGAKRPMEMRIPGRSNETVRYRFVDGDAVDGWTVADVKEEQRGGREYKWSGVSVACSEDCRKVLDAKDRLAALPVV